MKSSPGHLVRRKPSPSMVVACLALVIALSGASYAAVTLPRNSVGTKQLKKNAVVSSKVKDRSLKATDFALGQLPAGPQGPAGSSGTNGTNGQDAFTDVGVAASTSEFTTTSANTFVDVPNASTTITVPAGRTATLIATFSTESTCFGGGLEDWCSVRILTGTNEMAPAGGTGSAFDSVRDGDGEAWEHNGIVRTRTNVGPGTYTVKVQATVVDVAPVPSAGSFRLGEVSLVVQAIEQ